MVLSLVLRDKDGRTHTVLFSVWVLVVVIGWIGRIPP